MKKSGIFVIFSILVFASLYCDEIEISGEQSGDWTSDNTYQVIGDVFVTTGNNLTIEAGTTVEFMGYFAIYITGVIQAEGTQEDSILFTLGENIEDEEWFKLDLQYSQNSASVISHCIFEQANFGLMCWDNANAYIHDNLFRNSHRGIGCYDASPLIENNTFIDNISFGVSVCGHSSLVIIRDNYFNIKGIYCDNFSTTLIQNNTFEDMTDRGIHCFYCESTIKDNIIRGGLFGIECVTGSDVEMIGNSFEDCSVGVYSEAECNTNFINNTFSGTSTAISIDGGQEHLDIINNIFYDNNVAIHHYSPEYGLFSNNLFWDNGMEISGQWIANFGEITTVNYNGDECDIYENLFMDPLFEDPENYDYSLTEDSPAINAGKEDEELRDPDGTIKDIGAFYYQLAPEQAVAAFSVNDNCASTSQLINFESCSYGDIDSYLWNFGDGNTSTEENPNHQYFENGVYTVSLTVSGAGGEDSITEDDYIQIMPQVEVSGDVSGVWSSGTCYRVVNNVDVSMNSELEIEAGALIKFMGYYSVTVHGSLFAQGTETERITFTSGFQNPAVSNWEALKISGFGTEASAISYCDFEYGYHALEPEFSFVSVSNCRFSNNYQGIHGEGITLSVSDSYFCSNQSSGVYVEDGSECNIIGNEFEGGRSHIDIYFISSSTISENLFQNSEFYAVNSPFCNSDIYDNEFYNCYECIRVSSPISIHHNLFWGSSNRALKIATSDYSPEVINNTFCNNEYGIYCTMSSSSIIRNNILFGNNIGLYSQYSSLDVDFNLFYANNIDYDGSTVPSWFGVLEDFNYNNDPCDENYNIFLPPGFVDIENYDYNLAEGSHCIDAGYPDANYYDPDGTICDIGAKYNDATVGEDDNLISQNITMLNNYPNPFNPETTISFCLQEDSEVELCIYNLKGQLVFRERSGTLKAGRQQFVWNGESQNNQSSSSGIYLCKLTAGNEAVYRKMTLLK